MSKEFPMLRNATTPRRLRGMPHIQQAKTSRYCGQACLAMLAGVPLQRAVDAVGHRKATDASVIVRAAHTLGLRPPSYLWRLGDEELPASGLVIVHMRRKHRKGGHWCCIIDGIWHDPGQPSAGMRGRDDIVVKWMAFDFVGVKHA